MKREDGFALLKEHLKNKNLIKHSLAVESCMKELAHKLGEDEEIWGLAGLVHDIDYEETEKEPDKHGKVGAEFLEDKGIDEQIVQAVKCHAGHLRSESKLDWALFAVDPLTGLIIASCLMHPDKKLASLDSDFVLRRFKEKRFAAGANREQIMTCKNLGTELKEFIEICLLAMTNISSELGL